MPGFCPHLALLLTFLIFDQSNSHQIRNFIKPANPPLSFPPFLSNTHLTPQSTVPREPKGINALSMACDQGIDVVSKAHQRKCINSFRSSHNHLPRRPTFFLQMLPSSRDLRRVVSPVMPQRGRHGARMPLHPCPCAFPPPS